MIEIKSGRLRIVYGGDDPVQKYPVEVPFYDQEKKWEPMKINLLPEQEERNASEGEIAMQEIETDQPVNEPGAHPKLKHARFLASHHGWREIWHRPDESRVRFKKGKDDYIDVWYTRMTVGTVITHPVKGRTALFRRNVSNQILGQIFKNPRTHTGEGYYER